MIWECQNNKIKIKKNNQISIKKITNNFNPLDSLKNILKQSIIPRDPLLPPFPVLVGYAGYPMIKYMENINLKNPDNLKIPDSIFIRPIRHNHTGHFRPY